MLTGDLLIGGGRVRGSEGGYRAIDPSNGAQLEPEFTGTGATELARACALAWYAFDPYRETSLEACAAFLEAIATRSSIRRWIDRARHAGDGPAPRPYRRRTREHGRTVAPVRRRRARRQLAGRAIDRAQPERQPLPRPELRLRNVPLGPVAVFGASNFPLAFSVAGGDTAAALAAGCPVVVKAHSAHPGTSELVGRAVQAAASEGGMPEGVFSLLYGVGNWLGGALVADSRIRAVGFTGSRAGGVALSASRTSGRSPYRSTPR